MKRLPELLRSHQTKLWVLGVAVLGLLVVNLGAVNNTTPEQWEYKAIWFRVNTGDNMDALQQQFTTALNREAANGWEYVGHAGTATRWSRGSITSCSGARGDSRPTPNGNSYGQTAKTGRVPAGRFAARWHISYRPHF